jgi:hypothetical protein
MFCKICACLEDLAKPYITGHAIFGKNACECCDFQRLRCENQIFPQKLSLAIVEFGEN